MPEYLLHGHGILIAFCRHQTPQLSQHGLLLAVLWKYSVFPFGAFIYLPSPSLFLPLCIPPPMSPLPFLHLLFFLLNVEGLPPGMHAQLSGWLPPRDLSIPILLEGSRIGAKNLGSDHRVLPFVLKIPISFGLLSSPCPWALFPCSSQNFWPHVCAVSYVPQLC